MLLVGVPNSVAIAAELYVQTFSRCLASLSAVREQEALRLQAEGQHGDFIYFDEVIEAANNLAAKAVELEFGPNVLDELGDMSIRTPRAAMAPPANLGPDPSVAIPATNPERSNPEI